MIRRLAVSLALVWAMAAPAGAAANDVDGLLQRLGDAYEGLTSLSTEFTQETRFPGFSKGRVFGGTLELVRPDRMRWDYSQGSRQQLYVASRQVILFAPDSSQAIISELSPASDRQVPLHLLADVTGIRDTYHVTPGDGGYALKLTPIEPHPQAPETIQLWLDPDTGLIRRVRLDLPGGSSSDITFSGLRANAPVDAARFRFTAPEGVHVVRPHGLFPKAH